MSFSGLWKKKQSVVGCKRYIQTYAPTCEKISSGKWHIENEFNEKARVELGLLGLGLRDNYHLLK